MWSPDADFSASPRPHDGRTWRGKGGGGGGWEVSQQKTSKMNNVAIKPRQRERKREREREIELACAVLKSQDAQQRGDLIHGWGTSPEPIRVPCMFFSAPACLFLQSGGFTITAGEGELASSPVGGPNLGQKPPSHRAV